MFFMKAEALLLLSCVFIYIGNSELTPKCISPNEIKIRAKDFVCKFPEEYHYIWSSALGNFIEGCYETRTVPKGSMAEIDQQSNFMNSVDCPEGTFQPTAYLSNTQCNCSFFKSKCDTTGSVIFSNGSTYEDRTCGCDYHGGYDFIHTPKNICYCHPLYENCTCYLVNGRKDSKNSDGYKNETGISSIPWVVAVSLLIGIAMGFGIVVERWKHVSKYFGCLMSKSEDRSAGATGDHIPDNMPQNTWANKPVRTSSNIPEDDKEEDSTTPDHSLPDSASKSKVLMQKGGGGGGLQPLLPRD